MPTFQEIIKKLLEFWEEEGCAIHQGYDLEVGAGTFNPVTFLRSLGPEPYRGAYIEPARRPQDGRYGDNPNRLQQHHQLQVILKPSPFDIQDIYLRSLEAIGFNLKEHDVRFVHDDWESPTLGAWGLGWEVWMDGMEVSQFTYFQCVGGLDLDPISGEITYGLERLAMYLQQFDNVFDLKWDDKLSYGDIFKRSEFEWSHYNFEQADAEMWSRHFDDYEKEAKRLIKENFPIPAYDFVMKASHAFNMLDARGAISVTERTGYIARIRHLASSIAKSYIKSREDQGFPLLSKKEEKTKHKAKKEPKITMEGEEDFLLEIGSEELPATFVPIGCKNLEKSIRDFLDENELKYGEVRTFGTPRRLSIIISSLAACTPKKVLEKKGPAVKVAFDDEGKPTKIGEGFLRSVGKETTLSEIKSGKFKDLEIQQNKGNDYLFVKIEQPSVSAQKLLMENLGRIIIDIKFPKKMRWNCLEISYARPLRWIVALFGKEVIPFDLGNICSGNLSYGHRQMSNKTIKISDPKEYLSKLKKHYVLADIDERRAKIEEQLSGFGEVLSKERVIQQVLHLTEWPILTVGNFDKSFLDMPKELLISEMVEHQKYFPIASKNGSLKSEFVITWDNDCKNNGNERVLSARLNDGAYLYKKDLQTPLESFNEKLKKVTFIEGCGSVFDKKERIVKYTEALHKLLKLDVDLKNAKRAADLCKADLASLLVNEFPELQGIAGKYYASKEGKEVALAIEEHWMLRGEKGDLPETLIGTLVSLADKIDNFICLFSLGKKPTSSSDPYALRRQAIGIIKTLIKHKIKLPMQKALKLCQGKTDSVINEIKDFIINRVKVVFQDYGFLPDEIIASLTFGVDDIYDTFCKVEALHQFRGKKVKTFASLFEVYKRAKGQTANEEKQTFDPKLATEKEEKVLFEKLSEIEKPFEKSIEFGDYSKAYELIATLQTPLADLFDHVKILADDITLRNNRIALLQRVFALFDRLLDFSKIQM